MSLSYPPLKYSLIATSHLETIWTDCVIYVSPTVGHRPSGHPFTTL